MLTSYDEPIFKVPETFGNVMLSWARAEYGMGVIVQHISPNKKVLEKFQDPKKHDPSTREVIEELREHARKEYEQFIFESQWLLKFREEWDKSAPGEYSKKDFNSFIEELHAARLSRNALAHDLGIIESEYQRAMHHNALNAYKVGASLKNPAELIPACRKIFAAHKSKRDKHINEMLKIITTHMEIIFRVATPALMFAHWMQDTNRIPPPKP